jgi:hypothetical protein
MPRYPAGQRRVRSTGLREPQYAAEAAPAVDETVEQQDIGVSRSRLIDFIAEHNISETRLEELARKFKAEGPSKDQVIKALQMYKEDNHTQRLMNEFDALWRELLFARAEEQMPEEMKRNLNAMNNATTDTFPAVAQKLEFSSSGETSDDETTTSSRMLLSEFEKLCV